MINTIIVDDEQHCIDTLSMQLKEYCPDINLVQTCRSGKAALEAIESFKPDLIFTDIEMPLMNGFQMLEKIGDIDFSVIFTTSFDQYAIKAIKFSALDYLLKPIDHKELIASVHKVKQQVSRPLRHSLICFLSAFKMAPIRLIKLLSPRPTGSN